MLALCYNVSSEVPQIEGVGWRCQSPDIISNPRRNPYWKWDFTKSIFPFGLTQYDRILVMDSDMVVLEPEGLGPLFRMPFPEGNIMAVPDCAARLMTKWTKAESSIMIQGGLFVLRPSESTFSFLKAARATIRSLDGGTQGFMSRVFEGNVTWLPAKFNYIRASACVNLIDRHTGYYQFDSDENLTAAQRVGHALTEVQARADVAAGDVTVAHFHFRPKPWDCSPRKPQACGMVWAAGDTRVDVIYEAWLRVGQRCSHSGAAPAAEGR